jgi:hypothetical protein
MVSDLLLCKSFRGGHGLTPEDALQVRGLRSDRWPLEATHRYRDPTDLDKTGEVNTP